MIFDCFSNLSSKTSGFDLHFKMNSYSGLGTAFSHLNRGLTDRSIIKPEKNINMYNNLKIFFIVCSITMIK